MSAKPPDTALHLPDLLIRGFRGIENLTIPRLGRVTLFAGKNGVGKTTLLEAVRIYAARGRYPVLADMLRNREEMADTVDEDGDKRIVPNWEALFHGRSASSDACISIAPRSGTKQLRIRTVSLSEKIAEALGKLTSGHSSGGDVKVLRVEFQGAIEEYPMSESSTEHKLLHELTKFLNEEPQLPSEIRCESLGPSVLSNPDVARLWDKVALTEDETQAVQSLNLILGDTVDRVTVVGDDRRNGTPHGRRAVVKIKEQDRPIPLRSLGDGAVRLFGVALALANSRGGFLVIDEAENGLHYAVQRDFWKMVLRTAHETNIQVLATTHSWDCVAGFAQAATDVDEVEGVLIRLERDDDQIRAVEYSEGDLKIAAEQGIEVR